ncbi:hypothetical protein V9T40_009476 [Parthenolecanium corni]|uniref:Uncharacterized protein n=1 Tax=Parthenolecanium corni TaxID=536013 RepID=A0AAN9TSK2_9HEMI
MSLLIVIVSLVGPLKIPQNSKNIPRKVPYLLVGGGTCSFSAFRAIKSHDPTAKVLLISSEPYYPYMRPPLTKEIWSDDNPEVVEKLSFKQWNGSERSLFFEPEEFFLPLEKFDEEPKGGLSVARGWSITQIDADKKLATLDDGTQIEYGKCLLATGIHPKVVPPFDKLKHFNNKVSVFRNIDDFRKLREALDSGVESVAIVGGSLLGSELACSLSKFGSSKLKVVQIFPEKGSLAKILPEYLSKWTTEKLREQGVNIISGQELKSAALTNNDKQVELTLSDGKKISVDHVVVATGSNANTELAKNSHLEIDSVSGGYLVNNELAIRSDLYAAGDCACYYDVLLGRRRVEHHDHAVSSGRLVGENMTGARKSYTHQPMFWSELGANIGFEAIGLIDPSLPTVAVYAKLEPSSEKVPSQETENNVAQQTTSSKISTSTPKEGEDYSKGIIFYLRDDIVIGIILWNLYGKVSLARQVLKEQRKFEDLNEVAKLFEIHEE